MAKIRSGLHAMTKLKLRLLVLIFTFFLSTPAFSLEEKVRIGTSSPSVGSSPYFFAAKKGFYRGERLEAEIIFVRANIAIAALMSSEVDFITFFGSTLRASLRGLPVKNVMVVMSGTDHFLVARPEIRDLHGLRGKKIGISSFGATVDQEARAALKKARLKPGTDASLLALGGQEVRMAALETLAVDATVLDSVRTAFMARRGFNALANLGELLRAPFMGIGVSHGKIKNKPDQILKVIRGTIKAVRYIKENPSEAQKALAELLVIREPEIIRSVYELVVGLYNDRVLPDSFLQTVVEEEIEQLGIKRSVSLSEVMDWSFLRQIQEKR